MKDFEKMLAMVSLTESFDDESTAMAMMGMCLDTIACKFKTPVTSLLAELVQVVREVNESEGPIEELLGAKCTVKLTRKEQEND